MASCPKCTGPVAKTKDGRSCKRCGPIVPIQANVPRFTF